MAVLAPSLVRIRTAINTRWPNRDRRSDGWIGDSAHAATKSDHNPDAKGMVHALDVDVDGVDPAALVAAMCAHLATRYVIYNRRIRHRSTGFAAREYTGSNPHTSHIHLSIEHTKAAEQSTAPLLLIAAVAAVPAVPAGVDLRTGILKLLPTLRRGSTGRPVRRIQALLNLWDHQLEPDSDYGQATTVAVRLHQAANKLEVDGVVGPATWASVVPELPELETGADSHPVRVGQALLTCFGYTISTDGVYGSLTEKAIREFQTRHGLDSDGVVGRNTWTALWTR